MAITRFWVYPTCDIHLLLTAGIDMKVEILGYDDLFDNWTDLATHPQTQYLEFDPAVVRVIGGKFTPLATGTTLGRVRHKDISDPADPKENEVLVRVIVHDAIDSLWFGNTGPPFTREKAITSSVSLRGLQMEALAISLLIPILILVQPALLF